MKMSKVGNQTNSQDPQAVNSRVFVGNLNTFQCSKTDVERMFQRYGRLAGISMHKGYAFVQFTNPFDARSACLGEDGRTILSQVLDVNMVAEPKPHQTGRKRQNVAKTGNDWDYYYDSYYASTAGFPVGPPPRLVPPLKRPRLMPPPGGRSAKSANNQQKAAAAALAAAVGNPLAAVSATTPAIATCVSELAAAPQASVTTVIDQLKTYSNPDILICGNCREMFTEIKDLIEHKKTYCKLRFTCKCHKLNSNSPGDDGHGTQITDGNTVSLLCVQCKDSFPNAWDLMVHAQAAHMVNIYELGIPKDEKQDTDGSVASSPRAASPEKEEILKNGSLLVNGNEELDAGDCEDNDRQAMLGSPDSRGDKDLEEMMDIESTAQACIMHALSIGSVPNHECKSRSAAVLPGDAPPLVALTNGKQ